MEFKNKLNKIKALLSIEVKLEQMKLVDGITILEAESFEPDYSVGIVTSEGIVPAPVGEYETVDGMIVVVEVEGIIKEVKPVEAPEEDAPMPTEAPVVEASAETPAIIKAENKALKVELEALKVELEEAGAKAIVTNPEPAVNREMTALEKFRLIKQNLK